MTVLLPETISKEAIHTLRFAAVEVLSASKQEERYNNLLKAMIMGNTYKHKVTITFHAECGIKRVHTTVWGLTTDWVLLKNGVQLPIRQIEEVLV